ncbi:MAG: hypothetical protein MUP70_06215 [Candidatus Aminicenantes bacterium]|nr:hypothetical protein [Candidatus Aminicenantes bacterium]
MAPKKNSVFQFECPDCHTILWIDPVTHKVLKKEKVKKKKGNLDALLLGEKKRKEGFDRKLEATAELQKEKMKRAREQFEKAFGRTED